MTARRWVALLVAVASVALPAAVFAIGMTVYLGPDTVTVHQVETVVHSRDDGIGFLIFGGLFTILGWLVALAIGDEEFK